MSLSITLLPAELLAKLWPAQRVVSGRRVSWWIRTEVMPKVIMVSMEGSSSMGHVEPSHVADSLRQHHAAVQLIWKGRCARSLLEGMLQAKECATRITSLVLEGGWMNCEHSETAGTVLSGGTLLTEYLRQYGSSLTHLRVSYDLNEFQAVIDLGLYTQALGVCTALQRLELPKNYLGVHPTIFRQALPSCGDLTHVDLRSNHISDDGLHQLAEALGDGWGVVHLNLSDNYLGVTLAGQAMLSMSHLLCKSPALLHLDLRDNYLGSSLRLQHSSVLQHLNISSNAINDAGVKALAEDAHVLSSLRELHASDNIFTRESMPDLTSLLCNCPALHTLGLRGGMVDDDGAALLVGVLPRLPALRHLDLAGSSLHSTGAQVLAGAVEASPSLRVLDLSECSQIGDEGWRRLAEAAMGSEHASIIAASM